MITNHHMWSNFFFCYCPAAFPLSWKCLWLASVLTRYQGYGKGCAWPPQSGFNPWSHTLTWCQLCIPTRETSWRDEGNLPTLQSFSHAYTISLSLSLSLFLPGIQLVSLQREREREMGGGGERVKLSLDVGCVLHPVPQDTHQLHVMYTGRTCLTFEVS